MFNKILSKIKDNVQINNELENLKNGSISVATFNHKNPKVLSERVQDFLNQLQNLNHTLIDLSYVSDNNLGLVCFITYNIEEINELEEEILDENV
jgi:PPE-repeat protein